MEKCILHLWYLAVFGGFSFRESLCARNRYSLSLSSALLCMCSLFQIWLWYSTMQMGGPRKIWFSCGEPAILCKLHRISSYRDLRSKNSKQIRATARRIQVRSILKKKNRLLKTQETVRWRQYCSTISSIGVLHPSNITLPRVKGKYLILIAHLVGLISDRYCPAGILSVICIPARYLFIEIRILRRYTY